MTDDKPVLIVTGGSRGLGQCVVERALADNFAVATFSRKKTSFIDAIEGNPKYSTHFYWQAVDINLEDQLNLFIDSVMEKFHKIDALVNNAGVGFARMLTLSHVSDIQNVMNSNLIAAILLARLCLKPMLVQQNGTIINISSIMGIRGYSGFSCYSAAKAGLHGFTQSLAREVGPSNIRVNAVAPGYFASDMVNEVAAEEIEIVRKRTPLKRLASMEDIINGIFFLLSSQAAFITGQVLAIDGGFTC